MLRTWIINLNFLLLSVSRLKCWWKNSGIFRTLTQLRNGGTNGIGLRKWKKPFYLKWICFRLFLITASRFRLKSPWIINISPFKTWTICSFKAISSLHKYTNEICYTFFFPASWPKYKWLRKKDEISRSRHRQMTFIEFVEAVARASEKLSLIPPYELDQNKDISKRRQ